MQIFCFPSFLDYLLDRGSMPTKDTRRQDVFRLCSKARPPGWITQLSLPPRIRRSIAYFLAVRVRQNPDHFPISGFKLSNQCGLRKRAADKEHLIYYGPIPRRNGRCCCRMLLARRTGMHSKTFCRCFVQTLSVLPCHNRATDTALRTEVSFIICDKFLVHNVKTIPRGNPGTCEQIDSRALEPHCPEKHLSRR